MLKNTNGWLHNMDNAVILFDLKKIAFDIVDHGILTEKLKKKTYGIQNTELGWFGSYLLGRKKYYSLNRASSETAEVRYGQSSSKHGRCTFLYSAMRELVCNGQLWAGAALRQLRSHKVSQREYFVARVWRKPSFGSQDYYNKSLMTILGLAGVLFCENEQTDKIDYRLLRRKYLLECPGKPGEVSKQIASKRLTILLSLYSYSFLLLSVSFSQSLVLPCRLCSEPFQHTDIVGLSQAKTSDEHIKQVGQLTELLLLFHENSPEENKGSSKHLRLC